MKNKYHYKDGTTRDVLELTKVLHREGGPAVERMREGSIMHKAWFINGKLHREDGPAEIFYDYKSGDIKHEIYCVNGVKHRIDGPAEISYVKNSTSVQYELYFFEGKDYSNLTEIIDIILNNLINQKLSSK